MNGPLPMTPKLLRVGLDLADMRDTLGRLPSTAEIKQRFGCSRATAARYMAALRGTRVGGRLPHATPAPQISAAEDRLMAEFGFTRDKAAEVLAYDRGEGLPA